MQVDIPGDHGGRLPPCGGRVAGIIRHRNHIGNTAVQLLLLRIDVFAVFCVKCIGVHVEAGGSAEDLSVPRPTVALVPLGAVCRHVHKIALLAPFRVVDQLIDQRIGGLDIPQLLHFGVDDQPPEIIDIRLPVPSGDLHETVAVKCKMLPHIALGSVCDIGKFRFCRPQIVIVKIPVLQDLAELEIQLRSLRRLTMEAQPAHHVLSHVQHRFPGGGMDQLHRCDPFMDLDGRTQAGRELSFVQVCPFHREGFADVQSRVIHLSRINAAGHHPAFSGLPGRIRGNHL